MEEGGSCSLPSQDVPTSPPCFSSLSPYSVPGSKHLQKELCSFLRVQVVLFSLLPEKFTGAMSYTKELRPHQLSRDQQTSPGAPRTEPQRFPEMGTLWWHTKITWSKWEPQCFSKLAHLLYSKLRLNLILVQELPPQQTDSAKNCQHSARLSQWSVCVSSATEFSVP